MKMVFRKYVDAFGIIPGSIHIFNLFYKTVFRNSDIDQDSPQNAECFYLMSENRLYSGRKIAYAQVSTAVPQVSPAPNPAMTMVSPEWIRPFLRTSSRSSGTEAPEVFPQ